MKNKLTAIFGILCFVCTTAFGQATGTWTSYLAYQNATMIAETPHRVFAVFNGDLLSYTPADRSIKCYSTANGLHGANIRSLNYSAEADALLIVYQDANIDIFAGDQEIYNLNSIKNNNNITNKTISNVEIRGRYAYLSTGFGILEIDLKRKLIMENYLTELPIAATCLWNDTVYAATADELLKAPLTANLLDRTIWQQVTSDTITQMLVFDKHLICYGKKKTWALASDGTPHLLVDGDCRQLNVFNNRLALSRQSNILLYSNLKSMAATDSIELAADYKSVSSVYSGEKKYWVAWGNRGLTQIALKENHSYEMTVPFIKLNSPTNNNAFRLIVSENQLLVTGGAREGDRSNIPAIFEIYKNGYWNNWDADQHGVYARDFISAIADPLDPTRYYVSSWGEGVYVFQNTEWVGRYSWDNSSLQTVFPDEWYRDNFIRVDGMAFDRNHNLYITNSSVTNGLSVLKNNGEWRNFSYEPLSGINQVLNQIVITRDNKKWINVYRGNVGIFVLDDRGTIDKQEDDITYFSTKFNDQQGREIGATKYSCLVEDLNGQVWAGTDNGPIYFTSAEQMGQGLCNRLVMTDEYDEEKGHYLMEGEKVTSIAVDGANRKWIGTAGSGIFLLDHSGTPEVTHYTTHNSGILSDNINSIAVHGETGEVFIATDQGICSYRGDATMGKADYSDVHAFPNPVYPHRRSLVTITGLMSGSWVKVTDMAGNLMTEGYSQGGTYTWNCITPRGETAKAGIYLVFADLPTGEQGVATKFMVIR